MLFVYFQIVLSYINDNLNHAFVLAEQSGLAARLGPSHRTELQEQPTKRQLLHLAQVRPFSVSSRPAEMAGCC